MQEFRSISLGTFLLHYSKSQMRPHLLPRLMIIKRAATLPNVTNNCSWESGGMEEGMVSKEAETANSSGLRNWSKPRFWELQST